MISNIIQFDQDIFLYLNGMNSSFWDIIMYILTEKTYWILFYLIITWCIIKNFGVRSFLLLIFIALVVTVCDQSTSLVKDWVQRYRPTHDPAIQHLVHFVEHKGGLFGFFSAHAANSFGVAIFTALLFKNKWYSIVIFSWALIVSYTRIYLGLHYPIDILAGMIWGMLIGFSAYKLSKIVERGLWGIRRKEIYLSNRDFGYIFIILFTMLATTLFIAYKVFI